MFMLNKQLIHAGAIIFVYKLLIMNNYNGLREGLHGGSELVQLNGMVTVSTSLECLLLMPLMPVLCGYISAFHMVASQCCIVVQIPAGHQHNVNLHSCSGHRWQSS